MVDPKPHMRPSSAVYGDRALNKPQEKIMNIVLTLLPLGIVAPLPVATDACFATVAVDTTPSAGSIAGLQRRPALRRLLPSSSPRTSRCLETAATPGQWSAEMSTRYRSAHQQALPVLIEC